MYEEDRSYHRQALAAVAFVPGIKAKVSYAASLAFPSRDYLAEREGSRRRRFVAALRLAGDRRPRPR